MIIGEWLILCSLYVLWWSLQDLVWVIFSQRLSTVSFSSAPLNSNGQKIKKESERSKRLGENALASHKNLQWHHYQYSNAISSVIIRMIQWCLWYKQDTKFNLPVRYRVGGIQYIQYVASLVWSCFINFLIKNNRWHYLLWIFIIEAKLRARVVQWMNQRRNSPLSFSDIIFNFNQTFLHYLYVFQQNSMDEEIL